MRLKMESLIALGIAALFLFGVLITNLVDANSTPLVVTVLGLAGIIINSRRGTSRVEQKVDRALNGEMEAKIENALKKVLDEKSQNGNEKP